MTLKLGDIAPDFTQDSTEGPLHFHEWAGNSWVVLFSHPKDFTPVCTTELGAVARLKGDFDKRGVKVIGLSVDSAGDHKRWANDIKETQGAAPNYPILADGDFKVSTL
ncbi:MAG TPA: redoxin domain-containing protein, partial [Stellaceae bacterium]|nr:redoxin domain-containing protein [Stellaceae bacterium]